MPGPPGRHIHPHGAPPPMPTKRGHFSLEISHGQDRHPPQQEPDQRDAWRQKLLERMQQSIKEQGSFGIRQTAVWLQAYKRARVAANRENSRESTLRKRIEALDECLKWDGA